MVPVWNPWAKPDPTEDLTSLLDEMRYYLYGCHITCDAVACETAVKVGDEPFKTKILNKYRRSIKRYKARVLLNISNFLCRYRLVWRDGCRVVHAGLTAKPSRQQEGVLYFFT